MAESFDAVVVGGGPAGATAACLLAGAGWKVAVLERACFPRRKVCGEYLSATNLPLLRRLGIAEAFLQRAGPPVRRAGLFAGETALTAPMPRGTGSPDGWGRALGREVLDTLLLEQAVRAGAQIHQPWSATKLERHGDAFFCEATAKASGRTREFRARVVIAAHGSWEQGELPTHSGRRDLRRSDLLAFKAHFRDAVLVEGLMPLLVFPGGYGGMVHTDAGRVTLSCCIRRDALEVARRARPDSPAAEAVLEWIRRACRGVREALARARRDGVWLSAGPIRPGTRAAFANGIFCVGNAAGEAHPIIAEGISMALQSAGLLCERLIAGEGAGASKRVLVEIDTDYSRAWRRAFLGRIRAAGLFAHVGMRPSAAGLLLPLFRFSPGLLTFGARWSGKAREVVGSAGEWRPGEATTDQVGAGG